MNVNSSEQNPPALTAYRCRTPVAWLISPKQETEEPFSRKIKSSSEKRLADFIIRIYHKNITGYPVKLQRSLVGNKPPPHIYEHIHSF